MAGSIVRTPSPERTAYEPIRPRTHGVGSVPSGPSKHTTLRLLLQSPTIHQPSQLTALYLQCFWIGRWLSSRARSLEPGVQVEDICRSRRELPLSVLYKSPQPQFTDRFVITQSLLACLISSRSHFVATVQNHCSISRATWSHISLVPPY
jgi:hypothetical protein